MVDTSDLEFGKFFENKAIVDIEKLLGKNMVVNITATNYSTHPDVERNGIDLVVTISPGRTEYVQVKSRKLHQPDFCFEVYKTNGRWALKPTNATWMMFYLSKYSKEPYCIWYPVIQKMWLDNYDELIQNIKPNQQGDGHCVYVSPSWFRKKHIEISRGKSSVGRLFG